MKTDVVIGTNYGDEAKGLFTAFLSRYNGYEAGGRFNGGPQAAHNVHYEHYKHTFSNVSAAFGNSIHTVYGKHMLVSPYFVGYEVDNLTKKFSFSPVIHAHPECRVITYFDVCLNAAAELSRGLSRHGSCGFGINETVTRNEAGYKLTVADLDDDDKVKKILKLIAFEYVPYRLKNLCPDFDCGSCHETMAISDNCHLNAVINEFNGVNGYKFKPLPSKLLSLVLEGAQGLGLDEFLGVFPHVTRSVTGLPWAIEMANEYNATEIQPYYATRTYVTRHGNGPLSHENEMISSHIIEDPNNHNNQWQGSLRFAPLDLKEMKTRIDADLKRSDLSKCLPPLLAVSCLDQIADCVNVYDINGELQIVNVNKLIDFIADQMGMKVAMVSRGPHVKDVEWLL